jgi:hypothetical protein
MRRTILAILTLAVAPGSTGICVAQAPVYKLLYFAPNPGSQGAQPVAVLEAAPGLFYFLSAAQGSVTGGRSFGPSVFSLTQAGSLKLVNALPFDRLSDALVQGSDGRLYGAVYISSQDSFYYSLSTSGQDLQQYPTGKWSSAWDMAVMPQGIYDRVGTIGNNQVWAFARIGEAGKVTIIYQLSPTDGIPNTKLVPAPDGNIYGVSSQGVYVTPPIVLYRLTPSGGYTQVRGTTNISARSPKLYTIKRMRGVSARSIS